VVEEEVVEEEVAEGPAGTARWGGAGAAAPPRPRATTSSSRRLGRPDIPRHATPSNAF